MFNFLLGAHMGFDCCAKKKRTSSCAHTDVAHGKRVAVGLGCEGGEVDRCQLGIAGEEGRAPGETSRIVRGDGCCPQLPRE